MTKKRRTYLPRIVGSREAELKKAPNVQGLPSLSLTKEKPSRLIQSDCRV